MSRNGFSRRRFLHVAGGAATMGLLGSVSNGSDVADDATERPRLRFVQLNDTHVDVDKVPAYRLANEKLRYLVRAFNTGIYFPKPDFVVGVGDMVNSLVADDFTTLKTILAGLKCPYYPVMGNHENRQQEGSAQHEALYRKTFGDDRVNYTFRKGEIEFVIFNDSGAPVSNPTDVGNRRRRWLREALNRSKGPKFLCCHIPLVPVREETVLAKSLGFDSYCAKDSELLKLVEEHSDDVVAVLSGHLHLTGVKKQNGVYHIVASGTAGYPCDFAYYEVFQDRVSVQMITLPDDLRTSDTDIHGLPRWKIDYTDATHPTHELYMSGNASERLFDIPLRSGN